jgi:hypothetical protein
VPVNAHVNNVNNVNAYENKNGKVEVTMNVHGHAHGFGAWECTGG